MAVSVSMNMARAALGQNTLAYGGLVGYWGQHDSDRLSNYCNTPGLQYVSVSFVNKAPENEASGYPGTNFAAHCWAGTYNNTKGVPSNLLSECQTMKQDIPYCRSKGVKVLLTIGGEYDAKVSNYKVTSTNNGNSFADFLYGAFGPYSSSWTGPRPIDGDDGTHNQVDGFNFDIEANFNNAPYTAMINRFRSRNPSMIIAGAPECPLSSPYFYMHDMISQAQFDALFIQFYNNPACDAIAGNTKGDKFNYDDWASFLATTSKSKSAKLYATLPASPAGAVSGYINPSAVKSMICKYRTHKNWGGVSLWDISLGHDNKIDGKSFNQLVLSYLSGGC